MFIHENNIFQDDNMMHESNDVDFLRAASPEDIPLIEAYDEQSFNFSDGMYHIEDF
ncbi:hypothetical protein [Nitrosomonas sp. Nm166]|uniref:hypothetical protein n=1 Tax=Nitrosomonas sp. Nm166 TaxID=1881054 RepID=UPI0008F1DB1D|nr:hypothetical protein [Nitrosomonas sp. Nm166]SFF16569.1 hypothetical protein SAMN05428977_10614 [Nitrosomonas sp. Nm166]